MLKILPIIKADLKNTRLDPTLLLMAFVPFLMLAFIRYGTPALSIYIPGMEEYYKEIITFFVVLNGILPGFIISFILLDEKDLQLIPVLKVTPVSLSGVLAARIVFMVVFGFLSSLLIALFNGLVEFSFAIAIQLSLLSALNAPIITLINSSIAKNKVEGLTMLKVANLSLMIPLLVFFIDTPLENLLAILPAFWPYKLMDSTNNTFPIFILGLMILLSLNNLSYRFALRKN